MHNMLLIMVRNIIKFFVKKFNNKFYLKSYSQEGEDMILNKLLENCKTGYFVDIGAHHPKRFSNTYFFYKKGWTGINIDAKPGSMDIFKKQRPLDINIEMGLSSSNEDLNFYIFNEPALNTFDYELANKRCNDKYFINEIRSVKCMTLDQIFDRYLPSNQSITFLTIDIEGYDLKVLKTNNWEKYRPDFLVVESYSMYINDVLESDIYQYLIKNNYKLVSKSFYSLIFKNTI